MTDASPRVWDRIERARTAHDVLTHPFYERWTAGDLSRGELSRYTGQYRHAVVAIAELSEQVAEALPSRPELAEHAGEERAHIELWNDFVAELEGDPTAAPTPETRHCVEVWTERGGVLAALARLYAIESGQPQISATKLEGLDRHYDVSGAGATRYFTVHRGRDVEHAAEGRALLEELIASPADEDLVVEAATRAFAANWRLLDGVLAA